jgi:uncharacterized protein (TIGR02145 family)
MGFVYAENANPSIVDYSIKVISTKGAFKGELINLKRNTTYYVRAYARNIKGISLGSQTTLKTSLDNNTVLIDIDGNNYNTVKIGTQIWMSENLKTTKYSNGESLINVDKNNDGSWNRTGSYRVYNDNIQNKATFGLLYNGQSVIDTRNICPIGWHIPSENDWQILELAIGLPQLDLRREGFRGQDLNIGGKLKQKGFVNWNSPNSGATDEFGFNAIAAGRWTGGYIFLYNETGFWSSTSETNDSNAWLRVLGFEGKWILKGKYDGGGISCRCVKN